ncbi:MAG: hypothetical protein RMH74_05165, partial [Candidatus Caldarchaeum sp.]|nr:hypothetical protein [Candidatus Caldarchaeum sp.]
MSSKPTLGAASRSNHSLLHRRPRRRLLHRAKRPSRPHWFTTTLLQTTTVLQTVEVREKGPEDAKLFGLEKRDGYVL